MQASPAKMPDTMRYGEANAQGPPQDTLQAEDKSRRYFVYSVLLALLPVVSFICQWVFSAKAGTQVALRHHLTVMVVDWVFIPFNYFAVRVIDWKRGARLCLIFSISVALNALTHAYWEYNGLDFGHMITKSGVVLPAGWVHLTFSTCEMVLLVAFVFCRRHDVKATATTAIAVVYFVTMGICGYTMHHGFILSDVIVFLSGIFFVLVYPRLTVNARG